MFRTSDSQLREPGFESYCFLKLGQVCSINIAKVHSAVNEYLAVDRGGYVNE